ncbi:uncharacterized protein N7479_002398 [Penicillium vulpinum]|uniref:uncharacterized protein n=1 Tax=Penicillium vulpinum TaxID=29845 RepID=UPI002547447C|nr:uncharacterized protein N7479_002398 [Penicillium vulpinum]KAJ5972480.1 hypothetical protein N7479_002398 [Penicillium vulpinum]
MSSDYEAPNIDIGDVNFVEIIKETNGYSLLMNGRGSTRHSVDLFENESRAYSRLKARGFYERGSVPDFYGVVGNIDPEAKGWQPRLKIFYDRTFPQGLDPEARPNGVLMEYIPDVHMFDLSNYTEQRARNLQRLLIKIHEVGIVHLDPYPRNMLIQGDSDRVLWIDYEIAQIFDPENSEHPRLFAAEREFIDAFMEVLGRDHKLGRYDETRPIYFE